MKKLLTLVWLTAAFSGLFAQAKYSNEFLAIGVGARAHGMAGAGSASVGDATAGFWNAAGLSQLEAPLQISAMHAEWFAGIAQYDFLSIAKKVNAEKKSAIGLSVIRLGIDQIPYTINLIGADGSINYDNVTEFSAADYGIFFSYGRRAFSDKLSVGGSAKIVRRVIGQIGSSWGFGADLGAQWRSGAWAFGLQGRDLTTTFNAWKFDLTEQEKKVFEATNNEIPSTNLEITRPRFILAGSHRARFSEKYSLTTALDWHLTTDGQRNVLVSSKGLNLDPALGFELDYNRFLQLRAGVANFQKVKKLTDPTQSDWSLQPNFGIGLRLGRVRIDYAFTNIGSVSEVNFSNIFSATIDLRERKKEPKG